MRTVSASPGGRNQLADRARADIIRRLRLPDTIYAGRNPRWQRSCCESRDEIPRPSPTVFACYKRSKTGGVEGLGMRLILIYKLFDTLYNI